MLLANLTCVNFNTTQLSLRRNLEYTLITTPDHIRRALSTVPYTKLRRHSLRTLDEHITQLGEAAIETELPHTITTSLRTKHVSHLEKQVIVHNKRPPTLHHQKEQPAVLRREGTPEVATMAAHEARAPALQRVGTPEEPRVSLATTTHRVRLDGDAWARVLEACPDLLKQEFTSDVCDATSLPPTSMRRLVLAAGSL
ncbi:hypothetical protein Q4I28_007216, partial [Leishmania naiffi]